MINTNPKKRHLTQASTTMAMQRITGYIQNRKTIMDDNHLLKNGFVVGVHRGGLIPAVALSHTFACPMVCGFPRPCQPYLTNAPTMTRPNIILVDDIIDSGETMKLMSGLLVREYPDCHLLTATLVAKWNRHDDVDIVGDLKKFKDDEWVVFTWENNYGF